MVSPPPLPPAGCWSTYASPNVTGGTVTEGTFFAEQMVAYGAACAAQERERCADIVAHAAAHGCACSDYEALAAVIRGEA